MMIDKEKREENLYRIIRCCGNCKFSSYYKGKQRRLVCLHGIYPSPRNVGRPKKGASKKETFYKKKMYESYPVTHTTAVCELHIFSRTASSDKVSEWCGAKKMNDYDGY